MLLNVFDASLWVSLCGGRSLLIKTISAFFSCWIRFWFNQDRSLTTSLEQVSESYSILRLFSLSSLLYKVSASNNRTRKNQAGYRLVFWHVLFATIWEAQLLFYLNGWSSWRYCLMIYRDAEKLCPFRSDTREMCWEECLQNVFEIVLCIYFYSTWNSR